MFTSAQYVALSCGPSITGSIFSNAFKCRPSSAIFHCCVALEVKSGFSQPLSCARPFKHLRDILFRGGSSDILVFGIRRNHIPNGICMHIALKHGAQSICIYGPTQTVLNKNRRLYYSLIELIVFIGQKWVQRNSVSNYHSLQPFRKSLVTWAGEIVVLL